MAATSKIPSDSQTSMDKEARGLLRRFARPKSAPAKTTSNGAIGRGVAGSKQRGGADITGGSA